MGSFDVGCGISNLAVHEGDKAGFLIMGKAPDYLKSPAPKPMETIYIYNTDLHKPLLPAVYGEYGDYGNLDNIEESATTLFLEKIFGKPVSDVIACISCSRGIYDSYGLIWKTYGNTQGNLGLHGSPIEETLISFGFEKTYDANKNTVYSFSGYSLVNIFNEKYQWSVQENITGRTLVEFVCGNNVQEILEVFGEHTRIYPGFAKADYQSVHDLNKLGGMFFLRDVFGGLKEEFSKNVFYSPALSDFDRQWNEFMDEMKSQAGNIKYVSTWDLRAVRFIREKSLLHPVLLDGLGVFDGSDDWKDLHALLSIMHSVNRMIIPSFLGEQFGNDWASSVLNGVTGRVLTLRNEENEEL